MTKRPLAYGVVLTLVLATTFPVGCVRVPQRSFQSYSDAFAETKTITEQLLLEYDAARRVEEMHSAPAEPSPRAGTYYPSEVTIARMGVKKGPKDPVDARRDALEVVSGFNAVLISLAEGRKPDEVKSVTDSLIGDLNTFATLISDDFQIPYAGQIGALISTVVTKLEEANNRRQFIAAIRAAEPIIQGILVLLAEDAQDIYTIKARQADRLWMHHQGSVAVLVRQMKGVAKECATPTGELATELQDLEQRIRAVYDRVDLTENSEELTTAGTRPFDRLTMSQLEQTLVQATAEADAYEAVINSQVAFHTLIVSYGQLLAETQSALTTVRLALDEPVDIRQQASELIPLVFAVKRNWEALNDARRSGSSH